jgi:large subunit ribosomal protein L16
MLLPKRTKFRKSFKHKIKGLDQKSSICFGAFGLKALESSRITSRQLEAARRAITRKMKREGRVWIQIFPHIPVTTKPTAVRMGKGKGSVSYWTSLVKPGKILFEIDGVSSELAKQALAFGAGKLPIRTKFVEKKNRK